jgi:hypothetical protein
LQEQLEQLEKDSGIEWKEYNIGDLFNIKPTKNYGLSNVDLLSSKGNIPVVSNTSFNNGITGYVGLEPTEKGNIITFSDTTTDEAIFYQPDDFVGYSHIQGMHKKFDEEIGKHHYLFILTAFKNAVRGKYNYGSKFNRENAAKEKIKLPVVNQNGEVKISFDFMEKFISMLNIECIATLKAEKIYTLSTYLTATGLKNYTLTDDEQAALDKLYSVSWGTFKIEDILVWQKKIAELNPLHLNSLSVSKDEKYPFYGQATINNGIIEYRHLKDECLNNNLGEPAILIHSNNQNIVYLDTPFYLKDGHGATSVLQSEYLDKMTAQFIMSSIGKVILQKYEYNAKATKVELKNTDINLPIKSDNTPDYDYMSLIISAMQKVVIKSIDLDAERKIEATREIVNNSY